MENIVPVTVQGILHLNIHPYLMIPEFDGRQVNQFRPKQVKWVAWIGSKQPVNAAIERKFPSFPTGAESARAGMFFKDLRFKTVHLQITPGR
jgi:hypothetical protein